MSDLPTVRATRARPTTATPVVLRNENGVRIAWRLEIVSVSGGLLSLSRAFHAGSQVKLMFVTDAGPVLTAAELLAPVSWGRQAFRFVRMCEADQRRMHLAIQRWRGISGEHEWIEKYRAAIARPRRPKKKLFRILAAAALAAFCAAAFLYRMM